MVRYTSIYLHVAKPDSSSATECPCCRFDALLEFPIVVLSEYGAGRAGVVRRCMRCWQEDCQCSR